MLYHVRSGSVVKPTGKLYVRAVEKVKFLRLQLPWVEFMNYTLEADDCEESGGEAGDPC